MNGIAQANPEIARYFQALYQLARIINPRAYVSSVVRGEAEQRRLYADYVAKRSKYPAAAPGTSKHERGLALDIGGLQPAEQRYLGRVWESWGGRWGGRFRDPIHFESRLGT